MDEPSVPLTERVPEEFAGVQVNFCKTPASPSFGRPAVIPKRPRGRPQTGQSPEEPYAPAGDPNNLPLLLCH
jgi:hypothetical protein